MGNAKQRGQIEAIDILVAVFIFFIILGAAQELWDSIFLGTAKTREFEKLKKEAIEIADQLALTPGSPANWHLLSPPAEYESIGFASSPRTMSYGRLEKFQNQDYSVLKEKLRVQGKEFSIQVVQAGSPIARRGILPGLELSVRVERFVTYNNMPALLVVVLEDNFYEPVTEYCDDGLKGTLIPQLPEACAVLI